LVLGINDFHGQLLLADLVLAGQEGSHLFLSLGRHKGDLRRVRQADDCLGIAISTLLAFFCKQSKTKTKTKKY